MALVSKSVTVTDCHITRKGHGESRQDSHGVKEHVGFRRADCKNSMIDHDSINSHITCRTNTAGNTKLREPMG